VSHLAVLLLFFGAAFGAAPTAACCTVAAAVWRGAMEWRSIAGLELPR
jgi:hypothetical protein